jgi:hypothetical protein
MIARCPKLQERWREATHTEITGGIKKGFRCILSDERAYQGRLGSAGHGMGVQYQEDWSTEMQSCIGWE